MKVFALLLLAVTLSRCDDGLFVQIKNGVLHGTLMETKEGREIRAFLGIPYAKPPVGKLRFKPPVPFGFWSGVKDASKVHPSCPQRNIYIRTDLIEGQEDCLFLNVYKPKTERTDLLPVMVFFHGGGWLCGHGNSDNYGPQVLLDRDVILVVPNYRLGALGFLTTGDEVVPGNNGLKDQTLSLKWVKENIEKFGGDPNSVTIFGESAGGVSVHLHMMSPLSAGLFHRGISQSGTALCPWAFQPKDLGARNSRKLAKLFNCPIESVKMVECLRKVDPLEIIAKDLDFMEWDTDPMIPFKPVQEPDLPGAFISQHPIDAIKSGNVQEVPWISGLNSDDGALRVAALYGIPKLIKELNDDFNNKAAISLEYKDTANDPDGISEKLHEFYFQGRELNNDTVQEVIDLFTDGWFLNGADLATYLHTKHLNHPVYYYLFNHRGKASFTAHFGDKVNDYGVCHADELLYLFPINEQLFPDKLWDEKDAKVAKLLTTLWANFATYGDPTPILNEVVKSKWESANPESMNYLYIRSDDDVKMEDGLYLERAKFWRNLPFDPKRMESSRDEL